MGMHCRFEVRFVPDRVVSLHAGNLRSPMYNVTVRNVALTAPPSMKSYGGKKVVNAAFTTSTMGRRTGKTLAVRPASVLKTKLKLKAQPGAKKGGTSKDVKAVRSKPTTGKAKSAMKVGNASVKE